MLSLEEVGRRRVIQSIDFDKSAGQIWVNGSYYNLQYDDLVDLVQAIEMIDFKLTGRALKKKFRPDIKDRDSLKITSLLAGDPTTYDGSSGDSPEPTAFYMLIEINDNRYDNWFTRLDELIKLLYMIIADEQNEHVMKRSKTAVAVSGALGHG